MERTAFAFTLTVLLLASAFRSVEAQHPKRTSTGKKTALAFNQTEPIKSVEKELKVLYEQLLLASKNKDEQTLRQILTENYSQVTADGRVRTKAIRLQETMSPNQKDELLGLETFDVFIYENAAVARCRVRSKGTFKGEAFDEKIMSTATFVKEGGVWRIAATHLSFVKP